MINDLSPLHKDLGSAREKNNDCNDRHQLSLEHIMLKKTVIAALALIGFGVAASFVANRYLDS